MNTGAILDASAIAINPPVENRGKELTEQITVGRMYLNPVKAGGFGSLRCIGNCGNQLLNILHRQFFSWRLAESFVNGSHHRDLTR